MELTEQQKTLLENKIYKLIKESFFENGISENPFFEKERKEKDSHDEEETEEMKDRRNLVMKWLDSAQQLHSVLSYKLWPEKNSSDDKRGEARSLFSRKWREEDNERFNANEINTLYNLRTDFISDSGLKLS